MKYKVGLISLGCEKNRIDAEILLATIQKAGYEIVSAGQKSDIIIINTCGFIEPAKKEAIEEIFNCVRLKESGSIKAIIVTGCLAERYKKEIMDEIPELDAVVGIGANEDILQVLEQVIRGQKVLAFKEKTCLPLSGARLVTTPKHYAYLKISEGCSNGCTYCAIPQIRGKFRSRTMEDILDEAKKLVKTGAKELILIAQDTTRYGEDLYGELSLSKLLKKLCSIEKLQWIRLLYCYPDKITDDLISVIQKEDKILKYMDLPLQHCNKEILTSMNRTGDFDSLCQLINKLREKIPNIVLRTTFMVGFPGETNKQFCELCEFINTVKFDRVGCFAFSPEEGTKAFSLDNQIDEGVKLNRQEILMNEQFKIATEKSGLRVGKKAVVIAEEINNDKKCGFGRSYQEAPDVDGVIAFDFNGHDVSVGDFITVEIVSRDGYDLKGKVVNV